MAYYFKENTFYPIGQRLTGVKKFVSLPEHKTVYVTPQNLYSMSRITPISMLASHVQGLPFKIDLAKNSIGFYDVETTKDEKFKLGVINNEEFTDPNDMVNRLHRYPIRVAHNSFRFDLPVLARTTNSEHISTYDLNKFKLYYIKDGIDLDLMFFARICNTESLALYDIAKELGIPHEHFEEFNLNKCKQDVEICKTVYEVLNVPKVCEIINDLISMDIHILQNVYFDRFLRYVLLNQYLKEGYLPLEYPQLNREIEFTLPEGVPLKQAKAGEYKDTYYYDVTNAYPNTAKLGTSIYLGETVFQNVQDILLTKMDNSDPELRPMLKKIAVALIGYMYDKTNYFCNPMIWYTTVVNFNGVMKQAVKDLPILWCNTDGFIIQDPIDIHLDPYNIRIKDYFKYIKIYNPNKYIGISNYDNKITIKGFDRPKLEGLKVLQERLKKLMRNTYNLKDSLLSLDTQDVYANSSLWTITIRKTSDKCTNIDYLEEWENLKMGFNDIVLSKRERKEKIDDWIRQF